MQAVEFAGDSCLGHYFQPLLKATPPQSTTLPFIGSSRSIVGQRVQKDPH